MSWQILAVSFGAFTILMYLIKDGIQQVKPPNLFFLIPPVSAINGMVFFRMKIFF